MLKRCTTAATILAGALLFFSHPLHAADLQAAKTLYASASYDEALAELRAVEQAADGSASREDIEQYRALCYIALGKTVDATQSLERLVNIRPSYTMSEADLSPKLVTMFHEVRRRVLPTIVRDLYTRGRVSLDAKRYTAAQAEFAQMLALIDDRDMVDRSMTGDMKTLAQGFMKLAAMEQQNADARLAAAAAAPTGGELAPGIPAAMAQGLPSTQAAQAARGGASQAASNGRASGNGRSPAGTQPSAAGTTGTAGGPAPASSVVAAPSGPRIYTEADPEVTVPIDLKRVVPEWTPPALLKNATLRGVLEIVINEYGLVDTAVLTQPISPYYDSSLLNAAKGWRFTPATVDGRPVKYKKVMTIVLRPLQ